MDVHLNTLYVTSDGASVYKASETAIVKLNGEKQVQVPLRHLSSIVCLGSAYLSPELMAACAQAGIHIAFFSSRGRFLARVEGVPGGNVILRRQQYRAADHEAQSLDLARSMVLGKLTNARQFLRHARRDAADDRKGALEGVCDRLAIHIRALGSASSLESVRGLEGIGAKEYFGVFNLLLKRVEPELQFGGRSRRPPKDRINALLSLGYMLLMHNCAAALSGVGLDPAVGFLHEERPGRLSLALDLMEELRIPVVDRLVISLLNRGQLGPDDFLEEAGGGWKLTDPARKQFLSSFQEAKEAEVRHPFLEQNTYWGRVPHLQAQLLARTLRHDVAIYPPFTIR